MKENLWLLKDLLEPWKVKFIGIWLHYQNHVYIDKLDDEVNKYNNTYHSTTEIKPVDLKSNTFINSSKEFNDEDPNLVILLDYQYI